MAVGMVGQGCRYDNESLEMLCSLLGSMGDFFRYSFLICIVL